MEKTCCKDLQGQLGLRGLRAHVRLLLLETKTRGPPWPRDQYSSMIIFNRAYYTRTTGDPIVTLKSFRASAIAASTGTRCTPGAQNSDQYSSMITFKYSSMITLNRV